MTWGLLALVGTMVPFAFWALVAERKAGRLGADLARRTADLEDQKELSTELAEELIQVGERTKRQIDLLESEIQELENYIMELEDDRLPGPDPLRAFASLRSLRETAGRIARDHGASKLLNE